MGQYHCGYCGAMVMAGMPHLDYGPKGLQGPGPEDEPGEIEGWPPKG